jgi:hypothetical protein
MRGDTMSVITRKSLCCLLLGLATGVLLVSQATIAADVGTWSGPVERTLHGVPRLVAAGVHYRLRATNDARGDVKAILDGIGVGDLTGQYRVRGRTEKDSQGLFWIYVAAIEKSGVGNAEAAPGVGAWTGAVERTLHGVPRLVVGNIHYRLQATSDARGDVKAVLDRIGTGELTGRYTVHGRTDKDAQGRVWIHVAAIEQNR